MSGESGTARRRAAPAVAFALGLLAGCGGGDGSGGGSNPTPPALTAKALAGQALFFDTSLSASGRQSCATCHVPNRAFTADPATDKGLPVPLGGRNMDLPGFRNTPSLLYARFTPAFFLDDGTPTGGFFRDGRASSLAQQAQMPFVTEFEMANQDAAEVVSRLQASQASLALFVTAFGDAILTDPQKTLAAMGDAIAAFETESPQFAPFTSKFDAWLAGQTTLTDAESRGMALFNNPAKGNCTACHPSQRQGYADHALFTDFTYDNIGIPRNWNIAANFRNPKSPVSGVPLDYVPAQTNVPADAEYAFYDLGLCGPFAPAADDPAPRPVFTQTTTLCGLFKVPSLRNVAITAPYFHNGALPSLHKAVQWYVTRDINNNTGNNPTPVPAGPGGNPYFPLGSPYLAADGTPDPYQYNDLPVAFDANVNVGEIPYTPPAFAGGQAPTLDASEIDDLVAFLCTLTDGYNPQNPSAYDVPAQCAAGAP
ncbi:MAG: diacylglycerol kinase [Proteobacteria bacterium]|nr:diacylglycerol kinase [Pseudomonadota bacterium]